MAETETYGVTYEQVWQAWNDTTAPWGGCVDREAVERVMALILPAKCVMTHTEPMDFAQCETHDTTFPLGETCKFDGREPWQVFAEDADRQRQRAVRAEHELAIAVGWGYHRLNDKQRATLDRMEAEVKDRWAMTCSSMHYHFDEQYRPDHDPTVRVTWGDGERIAEATINRHGHGGYWIADVDLLHNDHDDECGCEHCVAYRDEPGDG